MNTYSSCHPTVLVFGTYACSFVGQCLLFHRRHLNMIIIIIISVYVCSAIRSYKEECCSLDLNTITETLLTTVFSSDFQTAGADHW